MKISTILIGAALCLSLLFGCERREEPKSPIVSPATDHARNSADPQGPYYHGLIEEYRAVLAGDPRNLAALIALGNAYFDTGHWKAAITFYDHALMLDPQNADVRADMGTAYRNMGMSDRALAEYHRVLQQDPGHVNARYNLGIVYAFDKKDHAAAIHAWEELLKLAPNHPQADYIRSTIATFKKGAAKEGQ